LLEAEATISIKLYYGYKMIMRHGDEKAVDITVLTPIGPWGFNIIYIDTMGM